MQNENHQQSNYNLRTILIEHVFGIYCFCNGNSSETSRLLGINYRTCRNYLREAEENGYIFEKEAEKIKEVKEPEYKCKIFPTNEFRVRYRDIMINKDWL